MSYAQLDDLLPHHRKIVTAGRRGATLLGWYSASICYAQRAKTDGIIFRQALGLLVPGAGRPPAAILALLEKVRLWDPLPDGSGWRIHDYLDHNAPAAEREAKARKAARARWDAQSNASSMQQASAGHAQRNANRYAPPLLSSPTPLRSSEKTGSTPSERSQAADAETGSGTGRSSDLGGPDWTEDRRAFVTKHGFDPDDPANRDRLKAWAQDQADRRTQPQDLTGIKAVDVVEIFRGPVQTSAQPGAEAG